MQKVTVVIKGFVGLRHDVVVLFVGRQIDNLIGYAAVFHPPVRCLDEAVLIDSSVSAETTNESDVGTLGSLNRTHAPVVRVVHVTDFKTCAFARKTSRPKGRQASLMS